MADDYDEPISDQEKVCSLFIEAVIIHCSRWTCWYNIFPGLSDIYKVFCAHSPVISVLGKGEGRSSLTDNFRLRRLLWSRRQFICFYYILHIERFKSIRALQQRTCCYWHGTLQCVGNRDRTVWLCVFFGLLPTCWSAWMTLTGD